MISHAPVREAADTTLILPEEQILSVRSLGVRFHSQREPVSVIHDLSLTVTRGETLAIVGESGLGKSVTALAIMRLIEQDGGDIHHGDILFRRRNGQILDVTQASQRDMRRLRDLVTRFPLQRGILNRVTHQVHAVEHISFDLYPGQTLSLVGESGCGKSTTARALLQLVPSQHGSITFAGERIEGLGSEALHRIRRNIQLIFQDPYASLDPLLTVGFSIMEPLLVHGVMDKRAAEARVAQLLKRVGLLPEHAGRYPHEFSGGQRQRICIARALALNPKVVIADEAVSELDVSIRAQIVNLMMELQQEYGIAFLFISHDMAVVERISHRVAVMYLGQIVEIGPRQAVFENPQHPYTRKLMAAVPVADPGRRHHRHALLADDIPSPVRALGDEPTIVPLVEVGERHYVAHHTIAGAY